MVLGQAAKIHNCQELHTLHTEFNASSVAESCVIQWPLYGISHMNECACRINTQEWHIGSTFPLYERILIPAHQAHLECGHHLLSALQMFIFVAQKYSQYFRFILTSSISEEYNFYFFCSGCYTFINVVKDCTRFWAALSYCWLILRLLSTQIPRFFLK